MVLTLVIILFLGGIAAMLANYQVGMRWGKVAGMVSAIVASFLVEYLVCKGMGWLVRGSGNRLRKAGTKAMVDSFQITYTFWKDT